MVKSTRTQPHGLGAIELVSNVVQRVLANARRETLKKPRTLYVMRDYESKGEKKTACTPAGLLWQVGEGKVEFRVELPGFAGGQLLAFRETTSDDQATRSDQ